MLATALQLPALGLVWMLALDSGPAAAGTRANLRGLSLQQAILVLEERGLIVVYSSALVKPWMRIRAEPSAFEPRQMLDEIIAPFGLASRSGPNSVVAIVRGTVPGTASATTSDTVRVPPPSPSPTPPLEQIVVAASRYELTRALSASLTSLNGTDIENLPDIGDDTLRAMEWLPGTTSNGISARTSVRGGEAGENLVRFDGLRLYSPYHLKDFQNLFSAIDPRIVNTVDVYTGGFAPRFGDRMSSVVDIASLAPPAPLYRELSMSFFNTSALGAGRFADERGEWLASARRSNLDVWYHALSKEPGTPSYSDAFAKASYRLNDRLRLSASALLFTDEISLSAEDQEERANAEYSDRYVWVRIEQQPNELLTGETVLAHTRMRSNRTGTTEKDGVATGTLSDARSFTIESLQTDWSWRVGGNWFAQFGGEVSLARGTYDYTDEVEFDLIFDTPGASDQLARSRAIHIDPRRTHYAMYAAIRSGITPRLTTDVGLRWEDQIGSPRLGVRYELGPRTALRASWARVAQSQSIDELQISDGVAAFWAPQRTDHTSLAIEHRTANGVQMRLEAYEKRQEHLRPRFENLLNPFTLLPELNPDRIMLTPERGRVRGAEVLLAKSRGPLTWWLGYTWSVAKERSGGAEVFRSWDQTHALTAGINWNTERWNMGLGLMQRSGWPTTLVSLAGDDSVPVVVPGSRNANRTTTYRSLNGRIARNFALEHSSLSVFLEVVNVLGRENFCCSSYEISDETGGLELEQRHAVPRMPSLGFLWQF